MLLIIIINNNDSLDFSVNEKNTQIDSKKNYYKKIIVSYYHKNENLVVLINTR